MERPQTNRMKYHIVLIYVHRRIHNNKCATSHRHLSMSAYFRFSLIFIRRCPIFFEIILQITRTEKPLAIDTAEFCQENVSPDRYILFSVQQVSLTCSEWMYRRF